MLAVVAGARRRAAHPADRRVHPRARAEDRRPADRPGAGHQRAGHRRAARRAVRERRDRARASRVYVMERGRIVLARDVRRARVATRDRLADVYLKGTESTPRPRSERSDPMNLLGMELDPDPAARRRRRHPLRPARRRPRADLQGQQVRQLRAGRARRVRRRARRARWSSSTACRTGPRSSSASSIAAGRRRGHRGVIVRRLDGLPRLMGVVVTLLLSQFLLGLSLGRSTPTRSS